MTAVAPVTSIIQYLDANGNPLSAGTVDVYLAGTTTRSTTWSDQAQGTPNANPVVLDSRGQASIWLDPTITYDFSVKDSTGTLQKTYQNVQGATDYGHLVGGVQGSAGNIASAAGAADAITAAYTPAITALFNGMTLYVRAASANATTTPTFTPNSGTIAAKTIVKGNGLALAAGDIAGAGHWIELQYDLSLDKWVLLNPAAATTGFASSQTANGYVKLPPAPGQTKGMIIQWGSNVSSASAAQSVTFPIAFPTAFLAVTITPAIAAAAVFATTEAQSASSFSFSIWNTSGVRQANAGSWVAIGY